MFALWGLWGTSIRMSLRKDLRRRLNVLMNEFAKVEGKYEAYMTCFPTLAVVQQHPVIDTVILFTGSLEHLGEKFPEEVIVRVLFEAELPDVVHINRKFL